MTDGHRDGESLRAALAGDPDAWAALVGRYREDLVALAGPALSCRLRAKLDAEDVVQESLLLAFERLHQFRGSTSAELSAWLREILASQLSRFVRRDVAREVALAPVESSGPGPEPPASGTSPSGAAVRSEERQRVQIALAALPREYRAVLEGRERRGLSFSQIAGELGRSENAARKLWPRALLALRRELEGAA